MADREKLIQRAIDADDSNISVGGLAHDLGQPMTPPDPARGWVDIVFDGPPGPVSGRFVECENEQRASISLGEWVQRDDGYWVLRVKLDHAAYNAGQAAGYQKGVEDAMEAGRFVLEATRTPSATEAG